MCLHVQTNILSNLDRTAQPYLIISTHVLRSALGLSGQLVLYKQNKKSCSFGARFLGQPANSVSMNWLCIGGYLNKKSNTSTTGNSNKNEGYCTNINRIASER